MEVLEHCPSAAAPLERRPSIGAEIRPQLSVVIPAFNEAGNLTPLMAELAAVCASLRCAWEVIWVDNGSTDATCDELRRMTMVSTDAPSPILLACRPRVLHLPRRRGQSYALWQGLIAANGETIVTMDGDGQNDPADIPRLLQALNGADMVVGYRKRRLDPLLKRAFSRLANAVRNALTDSAIPDSGCSLRAFRRRVLQAFIPFDGMHRFLPTLAETAGFQVQSVEVSHRARVRGFSKYAISDRIVAPLGDCLMLRHLRKRRFSATDRSEMAPFRPESSPPADQR